MAIPLSGEQLAQLRRLADQNKESKTQPMMALMRFADDWNVDYSTIAREYIGFTSSVTGGRLQRQTGQRQNDRETERQGMGLPQRQDQAAPAAAAPRTPATSTTGRYTGFMAVPVVSPVAGVRAAPGSLYQQGKNWVLINARIKHNYEPRDIAMVLEPPLSIADYRRVEDGELLPSADQVAQLCQLLDVRMEEAFVMAGPERDTNRRGKGFIKGLSVLAILRARRRLNMKTLGEAVEAATDTKVTSAVIGRIERGEFTAKNQAERDQVTALAMYLEIPEEWVLRQVPSELVQMAASNNAKLHAAIRQAFGELQQIDEDRPHLLTSGGDHK